MESIFLLRHPWFKHVWNIAKYLSEIIDMFAWGDGWNGQYSERVANKQVADTLDFFILPVVPNCGISYQKRLSCAIHIQAFLDSSFDYNLSILLLASRLCSSLYLKSCFRSVCLYFTGFFFLGGLGVPHPAKILPFPPSDTCPRFWPRLVPPAEVRPRKLEKKLNTFLCQIQNWLLLISKVP